MNTVMIIALTLLGEARGEGDGGMYRVGCVIQQREINRGISPSKVCLQSGFVKGRRIHQFSCWNGRGPSSDAAPEAMRIAKLIANGTPLRRKTVGYADHYCTVKLNPKWAKGQKPVAVYRNHKFYKLRP